MADKFLEESLVSALGPILGNDNLGSILLLSAILCLGFLYVCIRYSMTESVVSPLTFIAWRFIVTVLYLFILQFATKIYEKVSCKPERINSELCDVIEPIKSKQYWYDLFLWGSLIGIVLLGMTIGIQYAEATESAAKTAFVIGMYVVVIPFAEMALSCFSYNLPWKSWVAIVIDIPGVFILSGCTQTNCFNNFQWGTVYNIFSMFCVAAHTLLTARGMAAVGTTPIIIFSFSFCAVGSIILALIFETDQWVYPYTQFTKHCGLIFLTSFIEFIAIILFTVALGIISTSRAAIVMSVESLSGAVCGYLILGEVLMIFSALISPLNDLIFILCVNRRFMGWSTLEGPCCCRPY